MGSLAITANLPSGILSAITEVFSKLPQRILWKWEDDSLKIPHSNIKISKWFPQQDILAHPNCRLFITHGGIHSLLEAVHFNVSILGVPVFADQFMNMPLAEECGFGKMIRLEQITVESLFLAIQESRCRIKHKLQVESTGGWKNSER
ncbi:unnamed protein product [Bemisia tabaci]|uniref:Glucuronosyltransferase n=1 Tax=Bemisia tabaci TaxID=7038 RepID=A0A9P0AEX2_BEMTA|nr:unnamed protein product [Bemisia tabaci]